jgi:autotransporter-associated beta strand protein
LGVQRTNPDNANGLASLGGEFLATANGTRDGAGLPNSGQGAFYNVSRTIDGHFFTVGERVLIKDETEFPERNGIYEVVVVDGVDGNLRASPNTMNLRRVAEFDQSSEMFYGTQVSVSSGSSAGLTYFMASPDIAIVNGASTDPSQWLVDQINANVSLLANAPTVTTVSNAIDVNANGSGTSTLGATSLVTGTVTFSGNITLQDLFPGSAESKQIMLTSSTTAGTGVSFSGIISEANGAGGTPDVLSLAKIGGGVVTLGNTNTYHGATSVQAGTLRVTNSSSLGAADGTNATGTTVTSGATLEIDGTASNLAVGNESLTLAGTGVGGNSGALHVIGGASNTWAGPVNLASAATIKVETGAGLNLLNTVSGNALTKDGAGTLTLTGANTYTDTTITAGTLQIGSGGTSGTLGTGPVADNGLLVFNRSDSVSVANTISGSGSVTQAGTGTTILTANNSYGNTTISAGTLQVGNGGTTGSLGTGPVVDNGSLVFNRTNTLTVSNSISGTGTLTQAGTGTTVLTGSNSYTSTLISAGTLQIGNGGTSGTLGTGPVTNNAAVVFNRSNTLAVSNAISGTGTLSQTGAGTTNLSAANTYSGNTIVSAGTLLVSNVTGSGTGSGSVSVSSGATLGGGGIIAPGAGKTLTVSAGAFLSVGDPSVNLAQKLTIDTSTGPSGAITLNGTLNIQLFTNDGGLTLGEADRLAFLGSGPVTLGGSLVVSTVSPLNSSAFAVNDSWKLLDWAGVAITGSFINIPTGTITTNAPELPTLTGGKTWDVSQLYTTGVITVSGVPEPARALLCLMGTLVLLARRRRSGVLL